MILAVACLLSIKLPNFKSTGQIVDTVHAYIMAVVLLVLTGLLPFIMVWHKQEWQDRRSKHMW